MNNHFLSESAPLFLRVDSDENLAPGATFGPIIRSVYIFECCTSGYGSVIINGREFSVSPGDFYILLPGDTVTHTASTTNPRRGYWCALDGLGIGEVLASCGISASDPFAPKELFSVLLSCMESLFKMRNETDTGSEFRRTAYIYTMLGELLRHVQKSDSHVPIRRAIGIMETHYNTALNVQSLADSVGLERSYFSTLFKNATGLTPHSYLTKLRVQRFCALIKSKDIPISLAAEYVGLDPQNFARVFKRETGKTPYEYKRSLFL